MHYMTIIWQDNNLRFLAFQDSIEYISAPLKYQIKPNIPIRGVYKEKNEKISSRVPLARWSRKMYSPEIDFSHMNLPLCISGASEYLFSRRFLLELSWNNPRQCHTLRCDANATVRHHEMLLDDCEASWKKWAFLAVAAMTWNLNRFGPFVPRSGTSLGGAAFLAVALFWAFLCRKNGTPYRERRLEYIRVGGIRGGWERREEEERGERREEEEREERMKRK